MKTKVAPRFNLNGSHFTISGESFEVHKVAEKIRELFKVPTRGESDGESRTIIEFDAPQGQEKEVERILVENDCRRSH